ncbi:hypothetical protein MSG28_000170 [Choristoneura fumiferana]|uniref:Uncharacterized protein n=1 Tax=Choristoneura fumiferana TaxID=7141 RepID=A0ACC0JZI0_CHOFU|nr:hypothetical protein MSG28_000170 [Choristoneura fumiferana]
MVSIVLMTTEEILSKNGFWFCLDSLWVAEELEPFQEVHSEDLYAKPLSKDFYYTKYPELKASESEEENSLSLSGFQSKHYKWKSKICIRKISTRPRSMDQLNTSPISNYQGCVRRSASLVIRSRPTNSLDRSSTNRDNRFRKFFNRLLQKPQPPPLEEKDKITARNTIYNSITTLDNFNDIDIPEYAEFEKDALVQSEDGLVPTTSTLKKTKRVSFSTDSLKNEFDCGESWFDTIYGVTALMTSETNGHVSKTQSDGENVSWTDIISICGASSLLRHSKESLNSVEELLSYSRHVETKPFDISIDDDEESGYTKFVVNKIYQTLKIDSGMSDSSPMKDLSATEDSESVGKPFNKAVYRLAPLDESPPENELQKNSDRVLSEHELRVQRSLQKLNVPEW